MPPRKRCTSPGCHNFANPHHPYCSKCYSRQQAQKNPIRYILNKLRGNAKRRKIPCSLTLLQFTLFCQEHPEYLSQRGRTRGALTLDRKNAARGYEAGNLRLLTCGENSRLGATQCRFKIQPEPDDGNPFGA
jgi:hypothetical protein